MMKNFNWLVKVLFYKHRESNATAKNTSGDDKAVFYNVAFINQTHAHLCTDASENMLFHFARRPIATMAENPRGIMEGRSANHEFFKTEEVQIDDLFTTLDSKGPFILALPLEWGIGHSVVAIGFAKQHLIYQGKSV
jgi:hypothetical protein